MNRKFVYRRVLVMLLVVSVLYTGYFVYSKFNDAIPDRICTFADERENIGLELPIGATLSKDESTQASINGGDKYILKCKLFGVIDFKDIEVNIIDTKKVVPCGFQAGVYLNSNGVVVVDISNALCDDGLTYEPALGKLKVGDYIMKINDIPVVNKEQMTFLINRYGGDEMKFTVYREERVVEVRIDAVLDKEFTYKIGIWVRDDLQGIGTITYMTNSGEFGALGHGISDSDTGELLDSNEGKLYTAYIWGIKKGSSGNPGGLCGVINYGDENLLADINNNTENGIFGNAREAMISRCNGYEQMEIGLKQSVHKGKAYIRCEIDGELKDYEVEITNIRINDRSNKGIVLKVTDKELLRKTNGIVQGMSGSPIIQDGKLIGAVTHVFVNDPSKGYGIFVEKMLEQR